MLTAKAFTENPAYQFFSMEEYDQAREWILDNTDDPKNKELVNLILRIMKNQLLRKGGSDD